MFNKIKKNMNMMKPNKTNKIMILLSLFLILLNESNNIVYADDIKVENGQLKITTEGITYKNKNEETEIKSWDEKTQQMDKPIKLSEEIIKSISGNEAKEVTLNYGYLLNGKNSIISTYVYINENINLDEGLLITGNNAFILVYGSFQKNNTSIGNGDSEDDIFGIIGVNPNNVNNYSTNYYSTDSLFSNKGETIINTENTLILYNRLSSNNNDSYL